MGVRLIITRHHVQLESQLRLSPVESEKDEVSLVVEGGDLSTHKLGVLREESGEQPADAVAQTCAEVIEDHLWGVFSWIFASSLQGKHSTIMMGSHSFIDKIMSVVMLFIQE